MGTPESAGTDGVWHQFAVAEAGFGDIRLCTGTHMCIHPMNNYTLTHRIATGMFSSIAWTLPYPLNSMSAPKLGPVWKVSCFLADLGVEFLLVFPVCHSKGARCYLHPKSSCMKCWHVCSPEIRIEQPWMCKHTSPVKHKNTWWLPLKLNQF